MKLYAAILALLIVCPDATAIERTERYWNDARGFTPLALPDGSLKETPDTLPLSKDFELYLRLQTSIKPYFRMEITGSTGEMIVFSTTVGEQRDLFDHSSECVILTTTSGNNKTESWIPDNSVISPYPSSFTLVLAQKGDSILLSAPTKGTVAGVEAPGFIPYAFLLSSKSDAGMQLKRARLSMPLSPERIKMNADTLKSRMRQPRSPMEGRWVILDRELEESQLRMGGDYSLLCLMENEDTFVMVYEDGARVNPCAWDATMVKARLSGTPVAGIFRCIWYDVNHEPLNHDVIAYLSEDSPLLTIKFPYQNSWIRLIKVPYVSR